MIEWLKSNIRLNWILFLSGIFYVGRCITLIRHPFLWAEDANIFYGPLLHHEKDFFHSVFSNYAGQHWFLVHIMSTLVFQSIKASLFWLPFASTLFSLLVPLAAAFCWLNARLLVPSLIFRQLIFGFILLAPSSWESLGNIANTYVYFFIGIFAVAGWPLPKRTLGWIMEGLMFVSLALTSICSIFLVAALLFRSLLNQRKNYLIWPTFLAGFVLFQIQGWSQRGPNSSSLNIFSVLKSSIYIFVKRIGSETLIGQNGGEYFSSLNGWEIWTGIAIVPILLFATIFKAIQGKVFSKCFYHSFVWSSFNYEISKRFIRLHIYNASGRTTNTIQNS